MRSNGKSSSRSSSSSSSSSPGVNSNTTTNTTGTHAGNPSVNSSEAHPSTPQPNDARTGMTPVKTKTIGMKATFFYNSLQKVLGGFLMNSFDLINFNGPKTGIYTNEGVAGLPVKVGFVPVSSIEKLAGEGPDAANMINSVINAPESATEADINQSPLAPFLQWRSELYLTNNVRYKGSIMYFYSEDEAALRMLHGRFEQLLNSFHAKVVSPAGLYSNDGKRYYSPEAPMLNFIELTEQQEGFFQFLCTEEVAHYKLYEESFSPMRSIGVKRTSDGRPAGW